MNSKIKSIAIIGGGPAGAALGTLLARKGYKVGIFDRDKRPPLIVGESLVPAVVPMLRELGIEEEVKSFSTFKPGATVCFNPNDYVSGFFVNARGDLPDYTYNTPRERFDKALIGAAQKAGAIFSHVTAKLEKGARPMEVKLDQNTLEATHGFFGDGPDLIVDASGRVRLMARLLDIPETTGERKDVCLFAHLDKVIFNDTGNVHLDHLSQGWAWRIPLPDRSSVGVVINPAHLAKYGPDIESQFDGFLSEEPLMKYHTAGSKRITPVVKYNNYQLISEEMAGPNWAMIGDAAGFLDPIFSTGVYLGMKSAFQLFKAIDEGGANGLVEYQTAFRAELRLWQRVVNTWYSGRLFNLYRMGQKLAESALGRPMGRRVQGRILQVLAGQLVEDKMNFRIFEALVAFGRAVRKSDDLVVV
jgi:flavin-dependent dehydrogenase